MIRLGWILVKAEVVCHSY